MSNDQSHSATPDGIAAPDALRNLLDEIPTTWLDPLLTGPAAVIGKPPFDCQDIERLLSAIRDRLRTALAQRRRPRNEELEHADGEAQRTHRPDGASADAKRDGGGTCGAGGGESNPAADRQRLAHAYANGFFTEVGADLHDPAEAQTRDELIGLLLAFADDVAVLGARPRPLPEPDWQPIDTAPKDGRNILLRVGKIDASSANAVEIGRWIEGSSNTRGPRGRAMWRYRRSMSPSSDEQHQPTAWMPLPAPPSSPPAAPMPEQE